MSSNLLTEDGGYLLQEDGSFFGLESSIPDAISSHGSARKRKRASLIEGGLNLPSIDDSVRMRKVALQNAAAMVLLH